MKARKLHCFRLQANIARCTARTVLISLNLVNANYKQSPSPSLTLFFSLHSRYSAPELYIADENQNPLYERHYEVNSTLELYCYVHNIEMTSSVVLWIHNDHVLNYDAIRGGIR
jgi:hypothetical protein